MHAIDMVEVRVGIRRAFTHASSTGGSQGRLGEPSTSNGVRGFLFKTQSPEGRNLGKESSKAESFPQSIFCIFTNSFAEASLAFISAWQIHYEGILLKSEERRSGGARTSRLDGVEEDWGKTRPYWCLSCGQGYSSAENVMTDYEEAKHGNETLSFGSRGLTKKQQLEAFRLRNR